VVAGNDHIETIPHPVADDADIVVVADFEEP
jgi:hypothetical protein